jgi:hypothetical protein
MCTDKDWGNPCTRYDWTVANGSHSSCQLYDGTVTLSSATADGVVCYQAPVEPTAAEPTADFSGAAILSSSVAVVVAVVALV